MNEVLQHVKAWIYIPLREVVHYAADNIDRNIVTIDVVKHPWYGHDCHSFVRKQNHASVLDIAISTEDICFIRQVDIK